MKLIEFPDGFIVHGESPLDFWTIDRIGKVKLVVADPPYGGILKKSWDTIQKDVLVEQLVETMTCLLPHVHEGSAAYVFGGIGTPGNRVFYNFLLQTEASTPWKLADHITWAKKRAYGKSYAYLFCREEIAYFVNGDIKKPLCFNVPYLEQLRGYSGYNKEYPAKSPYLRRTNVWKDITEMLRGKIDIAQKPISLLKIPIEVHTSPGDWVLDPFAGTGTTALAAIQTKRKFFCLERDKETFELMTKRIEEHYSELGGLGKKAWKDADKAKAAAVVEREEAEEEAWGVDGDCE